jgi:hypothetical protein
MRNTEVETVGPGGLATATHATGANTAVSNETAGLAEGSHAASGAGMVMLSVVMAC